MFKTFILGIALGAGGLAAALYFTPVVDQGRERSLITVQANGGNTESFHVNVPEDRIFVGSSADRPTLPAEAQWPEFMLDKDTQTELFKLRNAEDRVVGVASRIAGKSENPFVEWAVHMPARGTLYLVLDERPTPEGHRAGALRGGTREFSELQGSVIERFRAAEAGSGGTLELVTALVGPEASLPPADVDLSR